MAEQHEVTAMHLMARLRTGPIINRQTDISWQSVAILDRGDDLESSVKSIASNLSWRAGLYGDNVRREMYALAR